MKNLARLSLFFSLSFAIIFISAILLRFLSAWIDMMRVIPFEAKPGEDAAELAWRALSVSLYLAMLLGLSYSARRKIPVPLTIIWIIVMGMIFTVGVSLGINRAVAIRPVLKQVPSVQSAPGLILSRSENSMILLRESREIRGPRVVSIPGQPLIYQEVPIGPNNTVINLPALAFGDEKPWFVRSLGIDFSLSAGEMRGRLDAGFYPFAVYAFSLILLLGSLRFLVELSPWPLANIFLGALVFRLILTLEIFLNSREINTLLGSYLAGRAPPSLITPLVFSALGVIVIVYTVLTRLARPGKGIND